MTVENEKVRKSPNTIQPPDGLEHILDTVNLVPIGLDMPTLSTNSAYIGHWRWPSALRVKRKLELPEEEWAMDAICGLIDLVDDLPSLLTRIDAVFLRRFLDSANIRRGIHARMLSEKRRDRSIDVQIREQVKSFADFVWGSKDNHPTGSLTYFAEDIVDITVELDRAYRAVTRYEEFLRLRDQVRWIVYWAIRHPSWDRLFQNSKSRKQSRQRMEAESDVREHTRVKNPNFMLPLTRVLRYSINSDGRLEPEVDDLGKVLSSPDADIRRIRSCQYCSRIFWAGRSDKFCCTKRCVKAKNLELSPPLAIEEQRERWRTSQQNRRAEILEKRDQEIRAKLRSFSEDEFRR